MLEEHGATLIKEQDGDYCTFIYIFARDNNFCDGLNNVFISNKHFYMTVT